MPRRVIRVRPQSIASKRRARAAMNKKAPRTRKATYKLVKGVIKRMAETKMVTFLVAP